MILLAFDTSAKHCAVALSADEALTVRVEEMDRGQAERLMPLLEEVLRDANLSWSDLGAIGVGVGPGNFTGIRISVAAARGLALGLGIPAVGVSGFDALTAAGLDPVIPAPRDKSYRPDPDGKPQLMDAACPAIDPAKLVQGIAMVARDRAATDNPGPRPAPLYARPADAAPPADPAPLIIP